MQDQTLSFLLRRFEEAGITPRHQLGQNFLLDQNLLKLLVRRADIRPTDVVLEVGSGSGGLTIQMAPLAAHVVTVELDPQLYQLASEELHECSNVTILNEDILRNKNCLNPVVLEKIEEIRAQHLDGEFKLAANLPYNVATPIISNLLALENPPKSMTITIQKEVGDRMCAAPGTKDYGALSLWVQCQADVEIVRTLPPSVFIPRPKVYSAIVHIERNLEKRALVRDLPRFHEFIRAMFLHRRKFLRSELISVFKKRLEKSDVDEILRRMNLSGEMRAEQLTLAEMRDLCDVSYAVLSEKTGSST
ncbi:MAG: 16S rRNA (adenine(1518)-N(6)/adenine(1519)-N(6))-dimethyltransferase RsmA [Planctomycetia bacterium]|nr:16S rRNA (adenine(1518)-N(6)/adenine(1519)-N(6))-dimethyltransferase RsmA [Planctomycetia bacterium]